MKRYMPTFTQAPSGPEQWKGMTEDDDGDWYNRGEADAHIAEMKRERDSTAMALGGELIQAYQAIQRVNEELRTADKRLTDTRRAHGILRNVLKMLDAGVAIHPTSVVHDEIKSLMGS